MEGKLGEGRITYLSHRLRSTARESENGNISYSKPVCQDLPRPVININYEKFVGFRLCSYY